MSVTLFYLNMHTSNVHEHSLYSTLQHRGNYKTFNITETLLNI